ncbi:MAG: agarase, partial [Paraglaciecola chathamensis]
MNASKTLLFSAIVSALAGCSTSESKDPRNGFSDTQVQQNQQGEQAEKTLETLFVASDDESLKEVKYTNATGTVSESPASGLTVVFHGKENIDSAVDFVPQKPWDWSDLDNFNIAFDIGNQGEHSV